MIIGDLHYAMCTMHCALEFVGSPVCVCTLFCTLIQQELLMDKSQLWILESIVVWTLQWVNWQAMEELFKSPTFFSRFQF
jgi:hypothetical protein